MLTGNMRAHMFGGMPDYIRNLRRRPVVDQQPLPEIGAEPVAAPMPPKQTNAAPMGLMQQAAPQHRGQKPGMDMGLFNQSFDKPKMTWSDKIGIASGYLMDLDGSFGTGNADKFRGMYDERVDEQRSEFERKRQESIMLAAAQGDPTALAYLDPIGARNFKYNAGRDEKLDGRYEREWNREEGRYETEQERLARLEARGILESDRSHMLAVDEYGLRKSESESNGGAGGYGLNGVWGWDQASNKPVFMQPSKSGGLRAAEIPDGVELLDPYNTAFDRKLGTIAADAEGAKTPALMAVEAAEADMARLSQQIDLAITQTDGTNTGFWGQFNFGATDLNATLKTIRASGAFTSLVNLKAQGGTLGALSDTELQLLEAKIANVERSQNQEQIDKNLLELKNALQGATTRIRAAYEKEYAAGRYGRSGANGVPPMLARPTDAANSANGFDAIMNMYLPK